MYKKIRRILYRNSLSLVLFACFGLSFFGQIISGFKTYNQDRGDHRVAPIQFSEYFFTGHFIEATFENWESEFLQMGALVIFTIFLRQQGSPDSKTFAAVDKSREEGKKNRSSPWAVKRGGWILKFYQNSLGIALFLLFAVSFALHAMGGAAAYNEQQVWHGESTASTWRFMQTSQFWFQSFQNWQSEFLSVGTLMILAIFLRQKGSPQSKPVAASHTHTGP